MATRQKPDESQVFLTAEEMEAERIARNAMITAQGGDPEESPEERVKKMFGDLRADQNAKIRLYRRNGNNLSICQDYSLDDFESANFADAVRGKWGAGKYDVKLYGSKGVITSVTLQIQEPLGNPQLSQQNGGNELAQVLASMAEQQRTIVEILTRPAPTAPAVDPMEQMKSMMQLMVLMKEATAAPAPPPASNALLDAVQALRTLREMSSEINPPADTDKEPSMMQLAGQLAPLIGQLIPQQNPAPTLPAPVALPASFATAEPPPEIDPRQMPLPNMEPAAQAIPQPEPETDVNAMQKLALMNLLNKLIAMAKNNTDKQTAVDLIHEKAPDEVVDFLDTDSDEWWQVLTQVFPAVLPHSEYFHAVQKMFRDSLEDEPMEGEKK